MKTYKIWTSVLQILTNVYCPFTPLVLPAENQLDLSYKTKFISAIRLWRKRGEEKKVRHMVLLQLNNEVTSMLGEKKLGSRNLKFCSTLSRFCFRRWLSWRRHGSKKTSSSIPAEWLSGFEKNTSLALRQNWRQDRTWCRTTTTTSLRLWWSSWKTRIRSWEIRCLKLPFNHEH